MMLSMFNILIILFLSSINLNAQTVITSSSRLSWSQVAVSLTEALRFNYIVYVDDNTRHSLENVICSGMLSPFSCNSKFPPFTTSGIHNLQLTAIDVAESEKSDIIQVQVIAPSTPVNLTIVNNAGLACATYVVPYGIPCPSFGLDDSVLPARPVSWTNTINNYYYIDNSVSCTDVNNIYGNPNNPRCTIPIGSTSYPAGSWIEVHGGPYSPSANQFETSFTSCTQIKPCLMLGVGESGDTSSNLPIELGGFAIGCNRTLLGKKGCVEIKSREWTYQGSYFVIDGFFSNAMDRGGIRSTTGTSPNHFALRHLEVTAPSKFTGGCLTGALNIQWVIFRNNLHDCGDHELAVTMENDDQGIQLERSNTTWILENNIYHNGGDGIGINAGQSTPDPRSQFTYIGHNHIWENGENALDIKTAQDVIVTSNILHGYVLAANSDGAAIVVNDENATPQAGDWRLFIFNNIIYDAITGIRSQSVSYVFGNVIYNISNWCFQTFGSSSSSWWENNTCVNTNGLLERFGGSPTVSLQVKNNLLSTSLAPHINVVNVAADDIGTSLTNNQFSIDSGSYKWKGTTYTNLIPWESASSSKAINNKIGFPGFVNPTNNNYRLNSNSIAINQGTSDLSSYDRFFSLYGLHVNYDIDGIERPIGNWDIGAFEFH